MPPRYAYWTIIVDGQPTAFRAKERDELLPTYNQLARKNKDIALKYFSRGKLWDDPDQARWATANIDAPRQSRGPDWRPGGKHEDPRAKFKKGYAEKKAARAGGAGKAGGRARKGGDDDAAGGWRRDRKDRRGGDTEI